MAKHSAETLGEAIENANLETIEEHLATDVMPKTVVTGGRGHDPLELAATFAEKNSDAGRRLLEVLVQAASEETQAEALTLLASEDASLRALNDLLGAGAKVNAAKADGSTALLRAAGNGCTRATYALLRAGADPSLEGPYGDAREYASGSTLELVESKLQGNLLCPRQLLPADAELEATLRGWLAALPAFAAEHTGEVFYVFGLDGGQLRGNGERAFAKTLEEYRTRDSERYASDDAILGLRTSPGDWSYVVLASGKELAETPSLDALTMREDDDRTYDMVMTELLEENRSFFASALELTDDFRFRSVGHSY